MLQFSSKILEKVRGVSFDKTEGKSDCFAKE